MTAIKTGGNGIAREIWLSRWNPQKLPLPTAGDEPAILRFLKLTFVKQAFKSGEELPATVPIEKILGTEKLPPLQVGKTKNPNENVSQPKQQAARFDETWDDDPFAPAPTKPQQNTQPQLLQQTTQQAQTSQQPQAQIPAPKLGLDLPMDVFNVPTQPQQPYGGVFPGMQPMQPMQPNFPGYGYTGYPGYGYPQGYGQPAGYGGYAMPAGGFPMGTQPTPQGNNTQAQQQNVFGQIDPALLQSMFQSSPQQQQTADRKSVV